MFTDIDKQRYKLGLERKAYLVNFPKTLTLQNMSEFNLTIMIIQFFTTVYRTFSKKDHFFGQKISKILCLAFDFKCIYYMSSDY